MESVGDCSRIEINIDRNEWGVRPKSKDDFFFRSRRFTSCCKVAPSGGCSQCVHLDRRLELQKEQKKEEEEEEEDKGKYKWLRIAQTNQLPRQAGARGM